MVKEELENAWVAVHKSHPQTRKMRTPVKREKVGIEDIRSRGGGSGCVTMYMIASVERFGGR